MASEGGNGEGLLVPQPVGVAAGLPRLARRGLVSLRGAPKLSLLFLLLALVCAIFAESVSPYNPIEVTTDILESPSSEHWLGTDMQGRDALTRVIYGAQISVMVALAAVALAASVGTVVALLSGVMRGWVDTMLMRLTDGFLALPSLMVALVVISILGPSIPNVILVIGLTRWMSYARVIRGEVLKLMEMDFVRLAHVAGASRPRIMVRHIFPNVSNTLLVLVTLEIGLAVIAESSLSFLGFGVPRPLPSWGSMLRDAQEFIYITWWLPVFPGLAITFLVMSCNLTGDWLRDRLDPTRRQL